MKWTFSGNHPIYAQLIEQIEHRIITGEYPPGSTMPSVRTLAVEAEVNPNTMQKALAELEGKGLLFTQRTAGRYVTEDVKVIDELRIDMAGKYIESFLEGMDSIGISKDEAVIMLQKAPRGINKGEEK